jgi:hypothetical protein
VSEPAVAITFYDTAAQVYASARAGATLLFDARTPTAVPAGPEIARDGDRVHATLEDRFELELEPISPAADLGGAKVRVCRIAGRAAGKAVKCLGTLGETTTPPPWDELDAVRTVSALLDEEHAVLAMARRPRGAEGHGEELVTAWVVENGELLAVDDTRISTVYDGGGRPRSAGLELWLPGEDFARRGSGSAVAGSTLELEGLTAHVAVFRWRVEGREGAGGYELTVRHEAPQAA